MSACGIAASYQGEYTRAIAWHEDALARFRALGLRWPEGMTLGNLGSIALSQGNEARAEMHFKEAIAVQRAAGDTWVPAWAHCGLAGLALRRGDLPGAIAAAREAMTLVGTHNDLTVVAEVLVTVGAIAAVRGQAETAARLFGAEAALREMAGPRMVRALQTDREGSTSTAHAALGDSAFAGAWAEGRAWSMARAKAEAESALGLLERGSASPSEGSLAADATVAGLSPREVEVLRLVVAGKATPEIAATLFVSPRTVQTHLTNVYGKLGVANRAEAVAWAVRNGLA
jgi:DNA-binding CsgD family transcriptional regulator